MLKHFTTMLPFKHKWLNFKVSFKLHLFKFLGFESRRNRCEGLQCLCRLKVFLVLSKPSEYSGIETLLLGYLRIFLETNWDPNQ